MLKAARQIIYGIGVSRHMKNKTKATICSGVLAASLFVPGYAMAAYHSSSNTGVEILDYIENNRRLARENALTDEQKQLIKDTAEMKDHLKEPIDPKKPMPVAVEGDDLSYDQNTGAVYAKGNVRITQIDEKRFTSDEANGNLKTQDVDIEDKSHMLVLTPKEPKVRLDGYKTKYNYGTKTGTMENISGKVDNQYVKGERAEFFPEEVVIYNGTATKCSAKKPHYYSKAQKIEIWPNKEMILTDVDVYLGSVRLYHKDRIVRNIGPDAKDPEYPRVGYDSDDGVWVSQRFDQALAPRVGMYEDLKYTGKWGFRSAGGITWGNAGNSASIVYGYFEDSDSHWIKKAPSFTYGYGHRLGKLPMSYGISYENGWWSKNGIHSNHTYYGIGLSHDVIHLPGRFNLYLSMGYGITDESYNHSRVNGFHYDGTVIKDFDNRWSGFVGYHYSESNTRNSLFNYNVDDYSRKLEAGFSYRFSDRDRIVIGQNFDMEKNELKDVDYYWYHDIHCAQLIFRYRGKRHTWNLGFQFTPW